MRDRDRDRDRVCECGRVASGCFDDDEACACLDDDRERPVRPPFLLDDTFLFFLRPSRLCVDGGDDDDDDGDDCFIAFLISSLMTERIVSFCTSSSMSIASFASFFFLSISSSRRFLISSLRIFDARHLFICDSTSFITYRTIRLTSMSKCG